MKALFVHGRYMVLTITGIASAVTSSEDYIPPSSDPQNLHSFKEHVYFTANDGIHGRELWRCDASGQAELVADITPGPEGSEISKLDSAGDFMLFRVDPPKSGSELWRTDGTPDGTFRIRPFNPDINEGFDAVCGVWEGGRSFIRVIAGSAALWVTDGTVQGTKSLPMKTEDGTPIGLDYFGLIHKGAFFFSGVHPTRGHILAKCDPNGEMVTEIDGLEAPAADIFELDIHRLLFRSSDTLRSQELFISGGNAEYTHLLYDIGEGPKEGHPSKFTAVNVLGELPRAVFTANDGVHGTEPWITDGTPDGTRMIADVMPGLESSRPTNVFVEDNRIVFVAAGPSSGKELWMSTVPYTSAELLADVRPGPEGSDPYAICVLPDRGVFFSALNDVSGEELYFADPSRRVVRLVSDIYPGQNSSYPYHTTAHGGLIYFAATDPVHGRELWCAGEEGGARLLADIYTDGSVNPSSSPSQLTPAGDKLYFVCNDIAHGEELWVSDGSDAGTRLLKDIFPGPASSSPQELTSADGNSIYFTAEDGNGMIGLWRSDGTADSTSLVQLDAQTPRNLVVAGGTLFFSATRVEEGRELWRRDAGQAAVIVRDIAPGPASSNPRNLAVMNRTIYFLADDGARGEELWRSDGTEAGTVMVRDIADVPYESIKYEAVVPAGEQVFLVAGSGSQGTELWRYRDDTPKPILVRDIARWDTLVNIARP